MTAEINRININATRNLGVKLLKNSLKKSTYTVMNKIVPSKTLRGKINSLNEKKAELLTAPVQNIIAENQNLLAENNKLTKALTETEETLEIKEKFYNVMMHDLKNPIGAITSLCGLFPTLSDPEEIKSVVDAITKSSKGTYDLLIELNELRKANTAGLNLTEFNLHETVNSVLGTAKASADLKNLSLINSISGDLSIKADKRIMEMIVRNLISNAIKFTESGQVEIRATSVNGSPVEISVIDTGIGISKETMDKLLVNGDFVSTVNSRGITGSGFGIPLCKEFARLLGGELVGDSEEGKGTTFTFTVPKKLHLEPQN
jgi:signal transduction histidine kinase